MEPSVSCVSFRMTIPTISQLNDVWSPEFLVQGSPWKFYIKKTLCDDAKYVLGIYVYCVKEDKLANWSYAAAASFKILTFDGSRTEIEQQISPFVFDQMEAGVGTNPAIPWDDLFNAEKKYVKDDTVSLELKIDVKNPVEETKSELVFDRLSDTKFRLMVTNINNLMATRSPPFMLHKKPFNFVVYKSHKPYLGLYLYQRGTNNDLPIKLTMSAKLISTKDFICTEKIHTNTIRQGTLFLEDIISWDELFNSQNGFVSDNITTGVSQGSIQCIAV